MLSYSLWEFVRIANYMISMQVYNNDGVESTIIM